MWWNFAHLFMISLVPVATVWIASTRLAAAPVFVYAAVFVMVNVAYLGFVWEVSQVSASEVTPKTRKFYPATVSFHADRLSSGDGPGFLVSASHLWSGLLPSFELCAATNPGIRSGSNVSTKRKL
ncbi:MAG TPA: hypothetical protein VG345_10390 [Bryobacteraceae bacterium]|nr:hypothetical protein [Bryobacteraceae bacterium]